jgi:hypothetical protein
MGTRGMKERVGTGFFNDDDKSKGKLTVKRKNGSEHPE